MKCKLYKQQHLTMITDIVIKTFQHKPSTPAQYPNKSVKYSKTLKIIETEQIFSFVLFGFWGIPYVKDYL